MMRKVVALATGLLLAGQGGAARWSSFGMEGDVQGENAVFTLSLGFEELERGSSLEVVRGAVTVIESSLPKDVELSREGEVYSIARTPPKGWWGGARKISGAVVVKFAARTEAEEGGRFRTRFDLPVLPVREVTVRIDDVSKEMWIGAPGWGSVPLVQNGEGGGRQVVPVKLPPQPGFWLSWQPDVRLARSELVASCDINSVASVSPGALRVDSLFAYQIAQGELSELVLALPKVRVTPGGEEKKSDDVLYYSVLDALPDVNVLSVAGADIQDWRIEPVPPEEGGKWMQLRVQLARPQRGGYQLHVVCEHPLPAFPCSAVLPVLEPRGMIRVGGDLLLGTDSAVRLQVASSEGLTQVDVPKEVRSEELGVRSQGGGVRKVPAKIVFAWQYAALPFSLVLSADNIATTVNAEMNVLVSVADATMTVDATVQMDVRDAPTRELRIQIPEDPRWAVVSVRGGDFSENDVDTVIAEGGREIVIPFRKPTTGNVVAQVRLEAPLAKLLSTALEGGREGARGPLIAVPEISVKGAKSQRGYIVLAAEKGMRLVPQGVKGLGDIHTASAPFKAEGAQLAYRFREAGWSLGLTFEYAQSAIHSEVFHLVSIGQGVVYVSAAVNGHISGAPVQTLRFKVPSSIQGLDVTGVGIDAWSHKDGVCTVRLVNRILGDFTLLLSYDRPISFDNAELTIGEIETLDTASELGYIAVATSAPLGVSEGGGLPPSLIRIPRDELPEGYATTVTAPVVGAWKYTRPDHALTLRIQALDSRQPIDQVVDFLQLESSIGNEGESITTATWQVKNTSRQYLEVLLPPDAKVWTVRQGTGAGARDIPAQQTDDRLLVPVERPRNPNEAISIEIRYAQSPGQFLSQRRRGAETQEIKNEEFEMRNQKGGKRYGNVTLTAPRLPGTPVTFATWQVGVDSHRAFSSRTGGTMSLERGFAKKILPGVEYPSRLSVLNFYRTATLGSESALTVSVNVVPAWLGGVNLSLLWICGVVGLLGFVLAVFPWRLRRVGLAIGFAAAFMAAFLLPGIAGNAATVGFGLIALSIAVWIIRGIARLFRRRPKPPKDDDDYNDDNDPPPLVDDDGDVPKAESPIANGVRASSQAVRAESPCANGGRASSRAVRAESPRANGGRASSRAVRAESPTGISVGRSPTSRGTLMFKPCKGDGKRIAPLQGLMRLAVSFVGLRPTLLPDGLSALMGVCDTPLQPRYASVSLRGKKSVLSPIALSALLSLPLLADEPPPLPEPPPYQPMPTLDSLKVEMDVLPLGENADSPMVSAQKMNTRWTFCFRTEKKDAEFVLFDGFSGRFMAIPDDTERYRFSVGSDGKTVLVKIRDKGECRLVFETSSMIRRENKMVATIPYFDALTASATITIPVVDLDVECNGSLWRKIETGEGRTTAEFILGPRTMLDDKDAWSIAWQPRARDTKAEKPVVYATFTSVAQLKPGVVETAVQAAFNVVQGESRMFTLSLPEKMTVIDVKHAKLATWRFDPATRRVEAVMSQAQTGMVTLNLTLQTACAPAPVELALSVPSAEGVDRQSGRIAIAAPESLLVRVSEPQGVIAVDATDFRAVVKSVESLRRTFRYDDPKTVRVPLGIEDVQPELNVQETSSFSLGDERSILSSTLQITVTRAGVFGVRLMLPEGYEIESLSGPAVSHWDDSRTAGRGIEVWFSGRVLDTTPVHLVLSSTLRGVPPSLAVPHVTLHSARRHTGRMAIAAERGVKLTVDKQDGVSLNRDEPQRGAAMVFNLLRPDWQVTLNAEVLPPVLKPDMLHRVDLAEGMLQHRIYTHYRIANAGVRFFRIRIPDKSATLTVSGQNIARVRAVDEVPGTPSTSSASEGRIWEIELHGKVEGTYNFVAQYQEPYDATAGSVTIKPVMLLDTARQASWLAVTCSGRIEVAPKGEIAGLKVEDARALPADFNAGDVSSAILCYRALNEEYTLDLSVVRHAAAEVLPAMVEQVRLVSVISSGGRLLTQATITLDPGHMRFLRVTLPDETAALWSAIVNGAEVPVSVEDGKLNIPLETATVGRRAEVVLIYADALGSASLIGDHALRAPRFPELPLRNIQWQLFVPPDFQYEFPDSAFRREDTRPQLRAFDKGNYLGANWKNIDINISTARDNLKGLDNLLESGQQMEARQVLQQAVTLSQAEVTLNEDARVQFRNVVENQVKMGLVNRRAAIRLDNNIFDANDTISQAGFNSGNFDNNYVQQVVDQLDANDRAGLELVARKLVDVQAGAATQGASIQVVMPEHGEQFTFTRPLQNELDGELVIPFRATPARTWGSAFALWPLLPGILIVWLMLGFLFGFRRGRR